MKSSSHKIVITPHRGPAYEVDMREFSLGGNSETVSIRNFWNGDYSGRSNLANEFAEMLETLAPLPHACSQMRAAMRAFYRFLDLHASEVSRCDDVSDSHGPPLRSWLKQNGSHPSTYKTIRTMLNRIKALNGGNPLFWAMHREAITVQEEPIEARALIKLNHALRHEARSSKRTMAEGNNLAAIGMDPRIGGRSSFFLPQNEAWLVREFLKDGIPDSSTLRSQNAGYLHQGNGPSYLAPGMDTKRSGGAARALRWFVPGRSDTAVLFAIFLIGTGWNVSTATALDVSSPENWCQPHPSSEDFIVIHSFKNRADRHQFTISRTRPEWHPYRILQHMIEVTAPLRRQVQRQLGALRSTYQKDPTLKLAAEIDRHEKLARCPWLYASANLGKVLGFFDGAEVSSVSMVVRETIVRHGLAEKYPRLLKFKLSDARDSWLGHAFIQSGYHNLLLLLASNHGSFSSLKHYINFRSYRTRSEKQVRKLQHALFSEIDAQRPIDPTRLRLLVLNDRITEEQEARLLDYRQRTRLGTGCLEPRAPDKHIAPGHREGAICRVQRCIGCSKGIVFPESLKPLTRALAELKYLRGTLPLTAWIGTSFSDEHDGLEKTLLNFDTASVAAELANWTQKLESGEIKPHDTYPEY